MQGLRIRGHRSTAHLSIRPFFCSLISSSVHPSIERSANPPIWPQLCLRCFRRLSSISSSVFASVIPSIRPYVHLSLILPSFHRFLHPTIHPFSLPSNCSFFHMVSCTYVSTRSSIRIIHLSTLPTIWQSLYIHPWVRSVHPWPITVGFTCTRCRPIVFLFISKRC